MFDHEKKALKRVTEKLKKRFPNRIVSVYAFGSMVRGDHGEWSDFDVLVTIKNKEPLIEYEIISIFVDEEMKSGVSFSPRDKRCPGIWHGKKISDAIL
ncbi:MAG: nucleotidyltransferase domain-containing protein [Nitrospirae bacterium]|nr:nucleotidyltransferase domain-containing protein [Nitrospirota bacterium]